MSRPVGGILSRRCRQRPWVAIHLCGPPGDCTRRCERATVPCLALLRVGFAEPPGSPRALVRSYRTVSPLPVTVRSPGRPIGGLFSVALSCGSPRLAVSQHPALRSPDLPRHGQCRAATTQPTHRRVPVCQPTVASAAPIGPLAVPVPATSGPPRLGANRAPRSKGSGPRSAASRAHAPGIRSAVSSPACVHWDGAALAHQDSDRHSDGRQGRLETGSSCMTESIVPAYASSDIRIAGIVGALAGSAK